MPGKSRNTADCFYDRFCFMNAAYATNSLLSSDDRRSARAELRRLQKARVYMLAPDTVECVLNTLERVKEVPPIVPPVPNLWVEMEQGAFVDGSQSLAAFHLCPSLTEWGQYDCMAIGYSWSHRALFTFAPERWQTELVPCSVSQCPYAKPEDTVTIQGTARMAQSEAMVCPCFARSTQWVRLISVLLGLLRAEGVEHLVVERTPKEVKYIQKQQGPFGIEAPVATQWRRISLSQRVHVRRDPDARLLRTDVANEGQTEITQVALHPRILIPGPGKPWRGDEMRVVWVRAHERHVRHAGTIRYKVAP